MSVVPALDRFSNTLVFFRSARFSAKSNGCRTYRILVRNSFSYCTYKNKGLITLVFAAHTKNRGVYRKTVNQEFVRRSSLGGIRLIDGGDTSPQPNRSLP
jgi:hypothetical protein